MLRGTTCTPPLRPPASIASPLVPRERETRMEIERHAPATAPSVVMTGERERMHEHDNGITMTFDPQEYDPTSLTTPLRSPRIPALFPDRRHSSSSSIDSDIPHQRQQSAPNLQSHAALTPDSRQHARRQSQGMPFTGDGRSTTARRPENSPGRFGGWLSAPNNSTDGRAPSPDTTPKSKRGVATAESTPKSATPSRFGFLASSMSALTTRLTTGQQAPATPSSSMSIPIDPLDADDELCTLDIEAALYPGSHSGLGVSMGGVERDDTFSPAAYKNLQVNAAGLLRKMQDAYRRRTVALKEAQAEKEVQREEAEEAELRARNFKNQLESMAVKAAEQERAMRRLVEELRMEREERGRREQEYQRHGRYDSNGKMNIEGPLITEDLCVDEAEQEEKERKRWRKSDGTVRSDLSIDTTASNTTDGESAGESESIFSRSRSPTAMTSATESENLELLTVRTPPPPTPSSLSKSSKTPTPISTTIIATTNAPQLSAFQKLVKGISGEDGCTNCRGQDSSVAWDTVSLLRDENRSLKHRVAQLEVVVEGALDVVNGIKIS
ncbi:uncharacterized protein F4822DRAFT_29639 [Hypoxylon trugodes]|uniref:uncharacterized protein n=1 Tax=Hypoxylon trugodes TaxID=326681 RepID=UPI002196C03F|nr:uncharacterized protein F4822DRAFT_29639 [Hypoxylon trugodes]KAI1393911.1 hypothetical protein F4822DRAFT_29639 [Hypoxylon trugodes]